MDNQLQQTTEAKNLAFPMLLGLLVCLFFFPNHNVSYLFMLVFIVAIVFNAILKDAKYILGIGAFWVFTIGSTIVTGFHEPDMVFVVKMFFLSLMIVASMAVNRPYLFRGVTEQTCSQLQKVILLLTVVLLFSQFVLIFKINPLNDFIISTYMTNEVFASLYEGEISASSGRSGGLFINPNQLAKAMSFLLVMAALALSMGKRNNTALFYTNFAVICVGVFVSGSRTGLLVILFIFLLWNMKYLSVAKILMLVGGGGGAVFLQSFFSESRLFVADSSAAGSLFYKLDYTLLYIDTTPFVEVMVGYGLSSYKSLTSKLSVSGLNFGFDADIGYSIFHFGIIGSIIGTLYFAYLMHKHKLPGYVYGVLLWVITSSIFFNIRSIGMLTAVFIMVNLKLHLDKQNAN